VLEEKRKEVIDKLEALIKVNNQRRSRRIKLKVLSSNAWCGVISAIGKRITGHPFERLKEEKSKLERGT
jgi:hypothetical protein